MNNGNSNKPPERETTLEAAVKELETCRGHARRVEQELEVRRREISCLHKVTALLQPSARATEDVIPEVLNALLVAYQYPEIVCGRITVEGRVYQTSNFLKTHWRQAAALTLKNQTVGHVEVFYLEERPAADDGPFLNEERHLIESVAGWLGGYLQGHREQHAREARYHALFEQMVSGYVLFEALTDEAGQAQDYRFLEVNSAFVRYSGFPREAVIGRTLSEVYPAAESAWTDAYGEVLRTGQGQRLEHYTTAYGRYLEATVYRPAEGQVAVLFTDVTERKQAETERDRLTQELGETVAQLRRRTVQMTRAEQLARLGYWESDLRNGRVLWSEGLSHLLGLPAEAHERAPGELYEYVHPEDRPAVYQAVDAAMEHKAPYEVEFRARGRQGQEACVRIHGEFEFDAEGRPLANFGVGQDITEIKRVEAALRESETRDRQQAAELELIYQTAPVGLAVLDTQLRYVRVNERLARMNGVPAGTHAGKTVREVVPHIADQAEPMLRRVLETGEPILELEVTAEKPAQPGVPRTVISQYWPLKSGDGTIIGINAVVEDVTDRKRLDEAHERERQFRTLADNSSDVIVRFDRALKRIYANPALAALLGRAIDTILGKTNRELGLPVILADELDHQLRQVFADGQARTMETVLPTPRGKRVLDSRLVPEIGPSGEVETVLAISRDITERKQAEEALRESREQALARATELEAVLEAVPAIVFFTHDPDSHWMTGSRATYELLRVPPGSNLSKSAPPSEGPATFEPFREGRPAPADTLPVQRAARGETLFGEELELRFLDGEVRFITGNAVPMHNPDGTLRGAVAAFIDVTERKRAEAALRESEEKYRTLVENLYEGIWLLDENNRTTFVNARMAELLGYRVEEMLGKHLFSFMSPAAAEAASCNLARGQSGARAEYDFEYRRKDGSPIWTHIVTTPLYDEPGHYRGALAGVIDITERKRAEEALRESEQRLQLIADGLPVLIVYIDAQERYRFINAAYSRWFGRSTTEVFGSRVVDIVGEQAAAILQPYIRRALAGETVRFSTPLPLQYGARIVEAVYIPHTDGTGRVVGFYGLIQDVSELVEYKRITTELRRSNMLLERMFDNVHVMLAYLDPAFNFIRVNPAYARADGRAPDFFPGKNHFDLFPNAENEAIFRRVVEAGEPYSVLAKPFAYAGHPERGVSYWDWSLQPVKDATGQVEGLVMLLINVTDKVVAMRQLEEAVADLRLRAAMMHRAENLAQLGYWQLKLEPQDTHWSEGMYRLFGLAPGQVPDHQQAFTQSVHPDDLPRLQRALAGMREGRVSDFEAEYRIRRADSGEEHVLFAQGEVERDAEGHFLRLFGVTQDVTERKRREWALRERFRLMADSLDDVVLITRPKTGEVIYVNPAYERVWGRACVSLYARPATFIEAIHPDDRERYQKELTADSGRQREIEYRIIRTDGTERWVYDRAFSLQDERGQPLTVEVARDITERKQAEAALYRREKEFEALAEKSPDIIARMDRSLRLRYINPAVERVTGQPREWFLGKSQAELGLSREETALREQSLRRLFDSGQEQVREYRHFTPEGERYFQSRQVPEFGPDGRVESVLVLDRDITDLKQAQQELERLTLHDPLTGVANRRYLKQFIEWEWRREARHRHPIALIMIDIDHFKPYNDHYGHPQGDACLREVAQLLEAHLHRPSDLLVRYGGEEFAAVLLETDLTAATHLAESMRQAIVDRGLPHQASPVAPVVTVSLGVDAAPAHLTSFPNLLNAADQALYRAKQNGRNRVEVTKHQ